MGAPKGNKNAAGPRDRVLSDALRKQLIQYEDAEIKQGEAAAKIAKNVINLALKNDQWAVDLLFDRVDGKPTQAVEHSGRVLTETISELHAREIAEEYLEHLRSRESDSSQEPDRLHEVLPPGLQSSPAAPPDRQ